MRLENPFRIGFIGTLGVLIALALGDMVVTLGTVITYIGSALFLALGFDPVIGWLESHKWPRGLAILAVLGGALVSIVLIVWAIIPQVITQINDLVDRYSAIVNYLVGLDVVGWIDRTFPLLDVNGIVTDALDWIRDNAANIGGGVLQVGFGIVNAAIATFIVFVLMIYFVVSMNSIKNTFYRLTPASKRSQVEDLTEQITGSVGKYVMGQGSLGLINGVLSFAMLSIVGGRLPVLFALVALIGSLIPMVGTISASIIIVAMQFALVADPSSPIWWICGIYYLVYMQVEAYVIAPRIMTSAVKVPGTVVVIAALAGGALLGVLGALMAIPVAASLIIILREVIIPQQNAR